MKFVEFAFPCCYQTFLILPPIIISHDIHIVVPPGGGGGGCEVFTVVDSSMLQTTTLPTVRLVRFVAATEITAVGPLRLREILRFDGGALGKKQNEIQITEKNN